MLSLKLIAAFAFFTTASSRFLLQPRSGRWWGEPGEAGEGMDKSYRDARHAVKPEIMSEMNDTAWFGDEFAGDKENDLLDLTLSVPDTEPTADQKAAAEAKEEAAMEALMPRIAAEEAEADGYYHNVYPWDAGNDLEAFTRGRNLTRDNSTRNATKLNFTKTVMDIMEDMP